MQPDPVTTSLGPRGSGFTLLEMILGLTVLVLIFGVMFRLVEDSLRAMTAAQTYGRRQQEVSGLVGFFRAFCMDLPKASTLAFKKNEEAIQFSNSQVALLKGEFGGRVLEIYRDKKNDRLMLEERIFDAQRPSSRPREVVRFCLATNVTRFEWLAHDPRNPSKPVAEWKDVEKPAYLTLSFRRGAEDVRADFWVPYGLPPGGAVPPPSPPAGQTP